MADVTNKAGVKVPESLKAMLLLTILGIMLVGVWVYQFNQNRQVRPSTQPHPQHTEYPLLNPAIPVTGGPGAGSAGH